MVHHVRLMQDRFGYLDAVRSAVVRGGRGGQEVASVTDSDRRVVRDLVRRVAELAASDEYETRRRRWRDVNGLRKPDRAPVWCRPARVWPEIIPTESLATTDPLCRSVEYALRQHLYKDWVGDDHILPPWWPVGMVWRCDTEHTWGLLADNLAETTSLGGWRLIPPIAEDADFDRVTVPDFEPDPEATERHAERTNDLLGDILPVRIECGPPLGPSTLNTALDQLRGMSAFLLDLAVQPARIHRLMSRLLEGTLRALRRAEGSGRLTPNNHEPMFCSDPIGPGDGPVRLANLWAAGNSQEFQEVSPAMFEEFLLNYQMPVLQQFGAVQYGCCEDLSRKIDRVMRIPNLRVFVCSAWTNLDAVVDACRGRCAIMWRQRATDVLLSDDLGRIREHLRDGMRRLQGMPYQVVLREVETLAGRPNRLQEWATLAREAAEEFA